MEEQAKGLTTLAADGGLRSDAAGQGVRQLILMGVEVETMLSAVVGDIEHVAGDTKNMRTSVAGLREHLEEIGAVAGEISGITSQTEMLALNASIEAAGRRPRMVLRGGGERGSFAGSRDR